MPYVNTVRRNILQERAERLSKDCTEPGDLNFVITVMLMRQLYDKGMRYAEARNLVGDTVCMLLEFYRTRVGPYEDQKIKQNGDIIIMGDKIK